MPQRRVSSRPRMRPVASCRVPFCVLSRPCRVRVASRRVRVASRRVPIASRRVPSASRRASARVSERHQTPHCVRAASTRVLSRLVASRVASVRVAFARVPSASSVIPREALASTGHSSLRFSAPPCSDVLQVRLYHLVCLHTLHSISVQSNLCSDNYSPKPCCSVDPSFGCSRNQGLRGGMDYLRVAVIPE